MSVLWMDLDYLIYSNYKIMYWHMNFADKQKYRKNIFVKIKSIFKKNKYFLKNLVAFGNMRVHEQWQKQSC